MRRTPAKTRVPKTPNFYPVILAGGRGTRFWPLSRKRRAKQMLPLNSDRSMIQETVERLTIAAPEKRFWVITNDDLRDGIRRQLAKLPKEQIVAEPAGRNTAPAIGLAAYLIARDDPSAVIGLFPSDHVIEDEKKFKSALKQAIEIASNTPNMVVMGIQPTRPETGYGYIEAGDKAKNGALNVLRFREKPNRETAEEFLRKGNYYWNSGMFVWGAQTLVNALREHLPKTAAVLEEIADAWGTRNFDKTLEKLYPKCENISVDYAVLEPRSAKGEQAHLYCIPVEFHWNDLGSWTALYEHHSRDLRHASNVIKADKAFELDASGNYIYSPKKFVAAVGVSGLVVVETEDALLITTRERAQDVGKIVKHLDEKKWKRLV
jgi:mannose-1-phosphate guanylyltransferase